MKTTRKKILLVDDSTTARMATRMLFADEESYDLISACDGKEGVDKAIAELPDLILMDVEMPRMSGFEACRILKQNEATRRIPIILLSMRGEDRFIREGFAGGCSDFLTKPVDQQRLATVLHAHLGK